MKTTKPAPGSNIQEQCGVWLDPVELKLKVKKKPRPISKLLNPFARGDGYCLAVALNFTQTKIEMPKAKQSSISSFFTPQHRVLNKMSTFEVPHINQTDTLITTRDSSTSTPVALVKKRKHDVVDTISNVESHVQAACFDLDNKDPDNECTGESVTDRKETAWHEYKYHTTPQGDDQFQDKEAEEALSGSKRVMLLPETSSAPGDSRVGSDAQTAELSEKAFSDFCSSHNIQERINLNKRQTTTDNKLPDFITKDSQRHYDINHHDHPKASQRSDTGMHLIESLIQSESGFAVGLGSVERTSTQKPSEHTYGPPIEESDEYLYTGSQPQYEQLSSISTKPQPLKKLTKPKTKSSQRRESNQSPEELILFPKRVYIRPNILRHDNHRVQENTLDLLFTQDSEGFRVIAHHNPQAPRSPLRDHTNLGLTRDPGTVAHKPLVFEEEEEMLFTQDSQGNMVIKH